MTKSCETKKTQKGCKKGTKCEETKTLQSKSKHS